MAGFLSGLDGLLKSLGITGAPPQSLSSQVPQPPSTTAAPAQTNPAGIPPSAPASGAAPPSTGGAEGFLENPLVQGAASAYLGTIGSPRRGGWGRALANG